MDFSIIIVNWNTRDLLKNCLQSIIEQSLSNTYEIIVVDNASNDGSCHLIKSHFATVSLIANQNNVGFSRANNQGILQSRGRYIILLNPDTLLLNDILAEIEQVFDQRLDIGIIGARLITAENQLQSWARGNFLSLRTAFNHYFFLSTFFPRSQRFKGLVDNAPYLSLTDMDWVSGACLAIRREVLDQVGLLDESIFMYSEDMELCYRTKQAGYRVVYLPMAQVEHFVSQSLKQQTTETVLSAPIYSQDAFYQRIYQQKGLFLFRTIIWFGTSFRLILRTILFIFRPGERNKYRLYEARQNASTAWRLWWRETFQPRSIKP